MNNFMQASKMKLRFLTPKGSLSTEQLWDLTLVDLTTSIKNVKKLINKTDDSDLSFLDNSAIEVDQTEQLRFDILKEVFLDKKATNEAIRTAKEDKEFNQKIENLIEQKQDDKLSSLTIEELLKLKR